MCGLTVERGCAQEGSLGKPGAHTQAGPVLQWGVLGGRPPVYSGLTSAGTPPVCLPFQGQVFGPLVVFCGRLELEADFPSLHWCAASPGVVKQWAVTLLGRGGWAWLQDGLTHDPISLISSPTPRHYLSFSSGHGRCFVGICESEKISVHITQNY